MKFKKSLLFIIPLIFGCQTNPVEKQKNHAGTVVKLNPVNKTVWPKPLPGLSKAQEAVVRKILTNKYNNLDYKPILDTTNLVNIIKETNVVLSASSVEMPMRVVRTLPSQMVPLPLKTEESSVNVTNIAYLAEPKYNFAYKVLWTLSGIAAILLALYLLFPVKLAYWVKSLFNKIFKIKPKQTENK